jgi:hypothetical protein
MARVEVRFQQMDNLAYWNPDGTSGFNIIPANRHLAWFRADTANNWLDWDVSSGAAHFLAGRQYQVQARALSAAGNLDITHSTRTTTYDDAAPETGVTWPPQGQAAVNILGAIAGTGLDMPAPTAPASSGPLTGVWLRLQRQTDQRWWGGSVLTWQVPVSSVQATDIFVSSWSLTGPDVPAPGDLTSGVSYYLSTVGLDDADAGGNLEAYYSVRGSTFLYDTSAPRSWISSASVVGYSTMSALASITGTTADEPGFSTANRLSAQTEKVHVTIRKSDGSYWQGGGGWGGLTAAAYHEASTQAVTATMGDWTLSSVPAWEHNETYSIVARSSDLAGNIQSGFFVNTDSKTVVFDLQAATAVVNNFALVSGASYYNMYVASFTGTAQDAPAGVGSLRVAVSSWTDGRAGSWWNGTDFSGADAAATYMSTSSYASGAWGRTFGAGFQRMVNGRSYLVQILAMDKAVPFNSQAWQYSFAYDSAAPTAYIGAPVSGSFINGAVTITGTALDVVAAAYSDVSTVTVSIQELSGAGASGLCYDWGGAFDQACPRWIPAGGTPANWSLTPPGLPYSTGRTYLIVSSATDHAGNRQGGAAVGQSSNTFTYNVTQPVAKFVLPNVSPNQSNLTQVTGTAAGANGVPLQFVQVRIYDQSQAKYWDNTGAFNFGTPAFDAIPADSAWYVSSATLSDWSVWNATFTFAPYDQHTLRFEVRAKDQAGNFDLVTDTRTFFYDSTPPESYPSAPANASFISSLPGDQLSGTATDAIGGPGSGIASVQMAIRRVSNGQWWNGTDFNGVGGPQSFSYPTTAPADPWVATIAGLGAKMASLPSGSSYYVTSAAQDGAGMVEAWYNARGSTFTFDTVRPTAGIEYPAAASVRLMDTLSGTAADDVAGVEDVKIAVHDETQPPASGWWRFPQNDFNGGAIQWVSASTGATGVLTATWTFALTGLNSGHSYLILAQASDKSGLVQNAYGVGVSSMVVIYDTTTPNSTVQVPSDLANRSAIASLSGVSSDPATPLASGVQAVGLRIMDQGADYAWNTADDRFWTGSGWQVNPTSVTASGTLAWNYNNLPVWDSNRRYRIESTAYDFAGMVQAPASTSTVVFDTAAPVSFVTKPAEDTGYGGANPLDLITGTADDRYGIPTLPAAGIASFQLSIREDNPPSGDSSGVEDMVWTGFGAAGCSAPPTANNAGWCPVTAGGQEILLSTGTFPWASWTYTAPNWTSGKRYVIRTVAVDAAVPAPNTEGDNFRHFSVDNQAPLSYIAVPVSGGAYQTLPQLSGTAQDDTSGVRQVEVCIKQFRPDGVEQMAGCQAGGGDLIWQPGSPGTWLVAGSCWVPVNTPATYDTNWSTWTYDSTGVAWPPAGRLRVMTRGMDWMGQPGPGNQENGVPPSPGFTGNAFSMDDKAPVAGIIVPADGAGYNASGLAAGLSGTASDWSGGAPPGTAVNAADTGLPSANGVWVAISSAPNYNTWWTGGSWQANVNPMWVPQAFVGLTSGTWSWTVGLPGWVSTRYMVLAKGIDNAGNDQYVKSTLDVGVSSNSFSYDNTAPVSTITWPTHRSAKNAVPTIFGTAGDDFSGIANGGDVYLRISSYSLANASTYYYTGGAGAWSLTPADLTANFAGVSSGAWTYTDAALPSAWVSGRVYTLFAHSKDKSNNLEVAGSTVSFLFDRATNAPAITAPAVAFYGPNEPLPLLAGSASDAPAHPWAQLAQVHVRIRNGNVGDWYWDAAGGAWTSTVETWNLATDTASWTLAQPPPAPDPRGWQDATVYEVNVRSSDTASNLSVPYATATFKWDSSTPTVVMLQPDASYETAPLAILSGTAKDPGPVGLFSDLTPVGISIQIDPPAGLHWDGSDSDFDQPGANFYPVTSWSYDAGNKWWVWSLTGSTPTWIDGREYRVRARAVDDVGNVSLVLGDQTFTFNKVPPITKITVPATDLAPQNASLTHISGTAQGSSGVGLSIVQLRVLNTDLGWYWDNWGTFTGGTPGFNVAVAADLAWFPASATVSDWTQWKTTTSFVVDKQSYEVNARSRDLAGNYDVAYATRSFLYDMTPPQSFAVYPANNVIVSTLAMASLTGTAWDGPGAVSGVASVAVAVKSLKTGGWWNGVDGFNAGAPPGLFYPTSWAGPAWTYASQNLLNTLKLNSGTSYYITARAADYAANTEAFFNADGSTFTFDNSAPGSGIAFPLDAGVSSSPFARGGSFDDVGVSTIALRLQDVQPGFGSCYMPGLGFGQSCAGAGAWFKAQGSTTAWAFTFPANIWTQGHEYVLRSSATDLSAPANAQVALSSAGFRYDVWGPTVAQTTPGYIKASVGFIAGTSTDSPAGVGQLGLALYSVTDAKWWSGGAFNADSPMFSSTQAYAAGSPDTWEWDFSGISVADGQQYVLASSATDKAGNRRVQNPVGSFWIDNSPPVAGISLPVNGEFYNSLGVISGTSLDNVAQGTVTLVVQDLGPAANGCYQPGIGFGAGCAEFPAQGAECSGVDCSWSFTGIPWVSGHRYLVVARAIDVATNGQAAPFVVGISSNSFVFDTAAPSVGVTNPIPPGPATRQNHLETISGTAGVTPPNSLRAVNVRVQRVADQKFWDPSSGFYTLDPNDILNGALFAEQAFATATYVTAWTDWTLSSGTQVNMNSGEAYTVIARSLDRARNYSTTYSSVTVVFDDTPPLSGVVAPAAGSYIKSLPTISGTLSDPGNPDSYPVSAVGVRVTRLSDRYCWDGSGWQIPAACPQTMTGLQAVPGMQIAVYQSSWVVKAGNPPGGNTPTLASAASYYITVISTDNVQPMGNVELWDSPRGSTFTFDNVPPYAGISVPANADFFDPVTNPIQGGSSDDLQVSTISLKVQDTTVGGPNSCYMPGLGFGQPCATAWFKAQGSTTAWSFAFPAAGWTSGDHYVLHSSATDLAGNWQVGISSQEFTYDVGIPTAVFTSPGPSGYVNAFTATISGTADETPAGVATVNVALSSANGSGGWWNGADFVGASPDYVSGFSLASYNGITKEWTWTLPPANKFANGVTTYLVGVRALTNAGTARTQYNYGGFGWNLSYDEIVPESGIELPVNGGHYNSLASINGTSSDNLAVSTVSLVVKDLNAAGPNNCWQPGAAGFNQPCTPFPAQGAACAGAACDWSFTGIPWTAAVPPHTFLVISSATDRAGNAQNSFAAGVSSAAFVYDTQVPTVKILFPTDGTRQQSLLTVTGTAAETAPGKVASVQLRFHQLNFPPNYADPSNPLDFGSAIAADDAWFNANSTTTVPWFTWSAASGTLSNFTPGATYTIEARAVNMSGNYSTVYSTITVVWDNGAYSGTPESAVTYPVNAAWMSSLPSITGTAADKPASNPGVVQGVGLQLIHRNPPASECSGAAACWWTGGGWSLTPSVLQKPTVDVQVFKSSWSLAGTLPSPADLVSGGTYYITSASTDNVKPTGNVESFFSAVRSSTFTADLDAPASSMTAPLNGQVLPSVAQLAGTAADALSGIADAAHIWVAMEEVWPGGACWDGGVAPAGTFTVAGCPALSNWYRIDQGGRGGTYNPVSKAWTVNAPALSPQYTYRVWVRASDNALPANNVQADVAASSITFTYDPNVPGAGITYPAAGGTFIKGAFTVTGTASNLAFAIKYASVAFQEADTGNYYDQNSATFSVATAGKPGQSSWLGAVVTAGGGGPPYLVPFNFSVAAPANFGTYATTGRQYKAHVTAITEAGNEISWPVPNAAFVYDTVAPASRPTYPSDGAFLNNISSVTGTAADPGAGASGIAAPGGTQIQIQRQPPGGPCWDGAGWNDGSCGQASWLTAVAGTPWNKNTQLPLPNNNALTGFVDGLPYKVFSRAYDVARNTETVTTGSSFTFDISSPAAHIQSPADDGVYKALALISGTAQDAANVRFPQVRIYRSGSYWNSVSKLFDINEALGETAWNVALGSSSSNDSFTWSYDVSSVTQTWAGAYRGFRADVRVRDEAGNYSVTTATFTFDREPPLSSVTFPPLPDGQFFSSMTALWGDSIDDAAGVSQVQVKMWYLSAGTTYYWNPVLQTGKHWTTTDGGFYFVNGSAGGLGSGGVPNAWSYDSAQNPDFGNPTSNFYAWRQATHDGLTGKTFFIQSSAADHAGNAETHIATRSFVFNNVPPTSGPSLPASYQAYTTGMLATISGTASPATGTIAGVAVSILSLNEPGGAKWLDFGTGLFDKAGQNWQPLLPTQVFKSSWAFNPPPGIFVDGRHYVAYSSATDNIGNLQSGAGSAAFLFDETPPTSQVSFPPTAVTKDNGLVPSGVSSDPNFSGSAVCDATQISGSGSGVYPVCGWQRGKVEVAVYRDTMPITTPELIFPGPAAYGSWGTQGYWWDSNTSTWVPASSVGSPPLWAPAVFNSAAGAWQFASLVCPTPTRSTCPAGRTATATRSGRGSRTTRATRSPWSSPRPCSSSRPRPRASRCPSTPTPALRAPWASWT